MRNVLGGTWQPTIASMAKQLDWLGCAVVQTPLTLAQSVGGFRWIDRIAAGIINNAGGVPQLGSQWLTPLLRIGDASLNGNYERRWQEFLNKIEIYNAVKRVEKTLGLHSIDSVPLCDLLGRTERIDRFTRGWAFEGIGYYHTTSVLKASNVVTGLLSDVACDELAPTAMTMLHAGMGMAMADAALQTSTTRNRSEIDRVLDEFAGLCVDNARDGYEGAALEALGLMVRTYYRELLQPIAEALRTRNDSLSRYFWHGVGRSVYFAIEYFPPCCDLDIDRAARQATESDERKNFIAGLAWAVTLVNLRNPDLIDFLVDGCHQQPSDQDALANGVTSSLLVAYDTAPDVQFMSEFCDHHHSETNGQSCRRTVIQDPCSIVSELNRMGDRNRIRMGDIYQFRPRSWFLQHTIDRN